MRILMHTGRCQHNGFPGAGDEGGTPSFSFVPDFFGRHALYPLQILEAKLSNNFIIGTTVVKVGIHAGQAPPFLELDRTS